MNDAADMIENVTYDELQVGQSARLSRTLRQEDIAAFAAVSGDVNPAHVDPEYASGTLFHGVIAHGMWSAALVSRLLGTCLPGPGTIYLAQTLRFHRPVRVGDELRITATVTAKEPAERHVLLDCEIKNQTGAVVLSGVATVIAPADKVRRPRAQLPQLNLSQAPLRYGAVLAAAAPLPAVRCAVVHPCDGAALRGALDAARQGLIAPLLVAPQARLRALATDAGLALDGVAVIDVPHSHAAAARAAVMAAAGEAEMLMQGSLPADELIAAVQALPALRTKRRLSHAFHVEVPLYGHPLLISDGMLNIQPSLADKVDIVQNAIELAQALGLAAPRVALLSARAAVTADLPSTLDAAALCKMAERGQINGGVLDGPLAFEHAISPAAARAAGVVSPVAGHADVLIAPDLEAGNLLAGQLQSLADAAVCGVLLGAAVPIAASGRAGDAAAHAASAALALVLAHRYRLRRP